MLTNAVKYDYISQEIILSNGPK